MALSSWRRRPPALAGKARAYLSVRGWWMLPPCVLGGVLERMEKERRQRGAVQTADIDTRVWILDLDHGGELDFVLVEPHRARPDRRVISILSPFGEALFGARVGDVVHPRFLGREYSVLVRRVAPRGQKPEP